MSFSVNLFSVGGFCFFTKRNLYEFKSIILVMSASNKPPKKQHTVPISYLSRFADTRNFVWIYDRERKEIRNQPISDTTIEKDYYTFQNPDGSNNYSVETNVLAKEIEAKGNIAIQTIADGKMLTDAEREYLCSFVTIQWLRTTASRRDFEHASEQFNKILLKMRFGTPEMAKRTIERYEKDTGEKLNASPEGMTEFVNSDNYSIKIPKELHIQHMLQSFRDIFSELYSLNWVIVRTTPNDYFLTSDNPLFVLRKGARPFVPYHISHGETTIPLTPHVLLYMHGMGATTTVFHANKRDVQNFNSRTMLSSDRFIISRKRGLLVDFVKQTKIDSVPRGPSVRVDSPF